MVSTAPIQKSAAQSAADCDLRAFPARAAASGVVAVGCTVLLPNRRQRWCSTMSDISVALALNTSRRWE